MWSFLVIRIAFCLVSSFVYSYKTDLLGNVRLDHAIDYVSCSGFVPFSYQPTPLTSNHFLHPHVGSFLPMFIAHIPRAKIAGYNGLVIVDDRVVKDVIWQNCYPLSEYVDQVMMVDGNRYKNVAVIAQAGHEYYYHFLLEVMGRLALLEMHDVPYDYVYVPQCKKYMRDIVEAWGIDPTKIIEATDETVIDVEHAIMPSLVSQIISAGCPRLSHYIPKQILEHVRSKILNFVDQRATNKVFSKFVFISRKDTLTRRFLNEDELFAMLKPYGFESYVLSAMSFVDHVKLFQQADIIVGPTGSGMANIIFCKSDVKIFDILQKKRDCTFWYLCQDLGLKYFPIQTESFVDDSDGQYDSSMPQDIMEHFIKNRNQIEPNTHSHLQLHEN